MYAQIMKSDMRVNLIGGPAEGLPIEHPAVICVDIGDRTDVNLYMKYDEETGEFYEEAPDVPDPVVSPPTDAERLAAAEQAILAIMEVMTNV